MSEISELRARANHYRAAAEKADLLSRQELLRIAADFDKEAERSDALDRDGDATSS